MDTSCSVFSTFVYICAASFVPHMQARIAMQQGETREKESETRTETERGYRWERKSSSSHTETINKLSAQSISYGLAWIIALCQRCWCAAWELAQGDVIVKYESSSDLGFTLIVTFVTKRAEDSLRECCGDTDRVSGEFRYRQMSRKAVLCVCGWNRISHYDLI